MSAVERLQKWCLIPPDDKTCEWLLVAIDKACNRRGSKEIKAYESATPWGAILQLARRKNMNEAPEAGQSQKRKSRKGDR